MNNVSNLILSVLIGLALVVPFVILELVNRPGVIQDFPVVLFGLMWVLSTAFVLLLAPIARNVAAGHGFMINTMGLWIRVALLIPIALFWVGLVIDQMPCFLGVPNCD